MVPRAIVLSLAVLTAAVAPGCIVNDYLAQEGELVVEIAASPPNEERNMNRSDVDDFRELQVLIKSFSLKPADGTPIQTYEGGVVVDLVKLWRDGPTELVEEKLRAKEYERWGVSVEVQKAVLTNGTHVHVAVPANEFLMIQYAPGERVSVPVAKTLTYRFFIAVVLDTPEIPGGPDGEYFLMSRPSESGPV